MRFKVTEIVAMIAAGIACIGAVVSAAIPALYTHTSRNRELDIKLVEIGIGILRADPNDTQTSGVREWAVQIIESYSGQRFSAEAKTQMLNSRIGYRQIEIYDHAVRIPVSSDPDARPLPQSK